MPLYDWLERFLKRYRPRFKLTASDERKSVVIRFRIWTFGVPPYAR